jgi:hypothetical protein
MADKLGIGPNHARLGQDRGRVFGFGFGFGTMFGLAQYYVSTVPRLSVSIMDDV